MLSILEDGLGVRTTAELEHDDIVRRFNEFCDAGQFAESTRWTWFGRLGTIIRLGHKLGLLRMTPDFPVATDPRKIPKSVRSSPPSKAAVEGLLEHLRTAAGGSWESHRLYALVSLIVTSGIPLVRALHLGGADVDRESNRIWMRPRPDAELKPKRIDPTLMEMLATWIPRTKSDLVFPSKEGGGFWHISGRAVGRGPHPALRSACLAAGIKPVTFEQLRRYYADTSAPRPPASVGRVEPAIRDGVAKLVVELGPEGEPPIVWGNPKRPLTANEYKLVSSLVLPAPGA